MVFHFLIALTTLTRDGFSKCVNEGVWGPKMMLVGLMWIGSCFIKSSFFEGYSKWAVYLAGIYLFV